MAELGLIRDFVGNLIITCSVPLLGMSVPTLEAMGAWARIRCVSLGARCQKHMAGRGLNWWSTGSS